MNHLLASFPAPVRAALAARRVMLPRGAAVIGLGDRFGKAYFPDSAVISGVVILADAGAREAGVVGAEGLVGFEGLWHQPEAIAQWTVQIAGSVEVVELDRMREAVEHWPATLPAVLAFCHAFLAQVVRGVACNTTHSAERRLARWLLLCHDRVPGNELAITHELVAQMLGMARPRVTRLTRDFQTAGLVRSARGSIEVVNRRGLERASCDCYQSIRGAYAALLPYEWVSGHPMAPGAESPRDASTGSSRRRSPR